jgi:hypothetical protein
MELKPLEPASDFGESLHEVLKELLRPTYRHPVLDHDEDSVEWD